MTTELAAPANELWESITRLDRDMRSASRLLGQREARYLVDCYYAIQDFRIQAAGQVRASAESEEPNRVLEWLFDSMRRLEGDVQKSLGEFSDRYLIGQWLQSLVGIGPVISAGLLAHLDVRGCKTAGHFWSFAGLDPTKKWEKKTKRPWNAKLKVLLWKAGESFIKFQGHEDDYYGKMFVERKASEWAQNLSGKNAEAAARALSEKNYGADTIARAWYEGNVKVSWAEQAVADGDGFPATLPAKSRPKSPEVAMLPPAHVHARARRWVEKVFLSHVHHAMYHNYYGEDPERPYVFEKCPGDHRHFIPLPNWPFKGQDAARLTELLKDPVKTDE